MQEAIARFEGELRELALTLAREVVAREAARRAGAVQGKGAPARRRGRPAKEARGSGKRGGKKERRKAAAQQLPLQLPPPPSRPASEVVTEAAAPAPATAAQPAPSAQRSSKRIVWTADSVIDALVPFVKSRMEVDASFVKRHGPKGLVAAAIRFFGRYPAALNRASLHAAKLAAAEPAAPST